MAVIQWLVYKPAKNIGHLPIAVFHQTEKAAIKHADSLGPEAEVHRTDFWYDGQGFFDEAEAKTEKAGVA